MQNSRFRRAPQQAQTLQADSRSLTDAEQVALSALAGAFTGFLIWLYWIVFHFALFVAR